jgi:limonene-1,2-epoxide hydrolase
MPSNPMNRSRMGLVALLLLANLLIGCASSPDAAPSSAEQANVKVVDDFIAAWDDPDRAVGYLAPQAAIRMIEDQPPIVGPAAIAEAFKGFMTPGVTLTVETLETTVHGPIVMNKRIDTLKTEGKPDQVFPVVGVFLVKNGKILEWTDYLDK